MLLTSVAFIAATAGYQLCLAFTWKFPCGFHGCSIAYSLPSDSCWPPGAAHSCSWDVCLSHSSFPQCSPLMLTACLPLSQVWPSQVQQITAVERSPAMLNFGASSCQHHRRGGPALPPEASSQQPSQPASQQASLRKPRVTWVKRLPELPGVDGAQHSQPRWGYPSSLAYTYLQMRGPSKS